MMNGLVEIRGWHLTTLTAHRSRRLLADTMAHRRRSMRRGRPSALRKRQRSNRVVKRATGPDFPRVKRSSRAGREAKAWHRALVDGIAQKGFGDCEVSIVGGPHTPDTPMTHPLNQCEKSHAKS
jgi:hypothetical protein